MQKTFIIIVLLILPIHVFADRYIEDSVGSSSGGLFEVIIGIVLSIGAIFYFFDSFEQRQKRHINGEKPRTMDSIGDWIFHLIGYAIVSIFGCFAILLILKLIGGTTLVRKYWYWAFLSCFGLLIFLRRT